LKFLPHDITQIELKRGLIQICMQRILCSKEKKGHSLKTKGAQGKCGRTVRIANAAEAPLTRGSIFSPSLLLKADYYLGCWF